VHQQPAHGRVPSEASYQEPRAGSPSYEEFQTSLPSITSILSNVQQSEPQQPAPHHGASLSKGQSSPTKIHSQSRQSRSPYPGTSLRRSQPFNPQTMPTRRESTSQTISQGWRDEPQLPDSYLSQSPYPLESQTQQRPPQSLASPVRTSFKQPYISPQDTAASQGFDFPYYPQESGMGQIIPAHNQTPFYAPTATTPYLGPGADITVQPYSFTPMTSQIQQPSGLTYVGDSRAMLQGRAVSMGALRGSQRIGTSPQEEDKRRRAASASARFRRRKKEQEEENLKEIARLEKKLDELKKE